MWIILISQQLWSILTDFSVFWYCTENWLRNQSKSQGVCIFELHVTLVSATDRFEPPSCVTELDPP